MGRFPFRGGGNLADFGSVLPVSWMRMRADIREVERLLLGPLRAAPRGRWTRSVGGRWSPIQVIEHVALGVDMSARGLEQRREAGPMARRRFGIGVRVAAWALLTAGYIPPGFKAPAFSAPAERPEPERVQTLLLDGVARFERLAAELLPRRALDLFLKHPMLGDLTLPEWMRFHVVHARHHAGQVRRRLASA